MSKNLFVMSCVAVTLAVAPACATKKFVRTEVGQVNDKVTTMGKSLEETQERVRVAEGRITEVDTKARGGRSVGAAGQHCGAGRAADRHAGDGSRPHRLGPRRSRRGGQPQARSSRPC